MGLFGERKTRATRRAEARARNAKARHINSARTGFHGHTCGERVVRAGKNQRFFVRNKSSKRVHRILTPTFSEPATACCQEENGCHKGR